VKERCKIQRAQRKKLYIYRKLSWGPRRNRVINLFEGGNTRANMFPWGRKSRDEIRFVSAWEGKPVAFFWKIAGDPGIFVPPLSPHSKRRTFVLSYQRESGKLYSHARAGANAEGSYLEMSREDFPLHLISSFFLLALTLSWRFECAASIHRAFLL